MEKISVFDKYNDYNKKTIELAIETMTSEERMRLKNGYGENYKGVKVINKHDVPSFELTDRKLKRRIEEVSNLLKEGKTEGEIKQKYSTTLLSSYTRKVVIPKKVTVISDNKLLPSFLDYFKSTPLIQKRVEKLIKLLSKEDKKIIEYYYIGSDFDILRSYYERDDDKYQQLELLISRLKNEAINLNKQQKQIQSEPSKKSVQTNNIKETESIKKENINNNPYNLLSSFLSYFPSNLKITINNFSSKEKQIISYFYDGIYFNKLKENYEVNDEKFTQLNILINKIKIEALKSLKEKENKVVDDIEDSNKDTKSFLDFFEEKDHERVLEIVKQFEITNPNYYKIITKRYSGEKFEIINNVKLIHSEYSILYLAKNKIKKLLLNHVKENKGKPFLSFFEEKDHEKVLEIVKQFKITNQVYYEVITKRYSGERFEVINDYKLTQKETANLNNAKKRIKQLLLNPIVEKKKEGFLDYFEEKYHERVLEIVKQFKITNLIYYKIITKRYSGERFEIKNDCKLTQEETANLNNAKKRIKQILLKPVQEQKKHGFLSYFEEKDYERVLEIIEQFKVVSPKYYTIIIKRYSGEKLEIKNNVKLSQKERSDFNNAIVKIRKILETNIISSNNNGLLYYFEEKDHERVLEIIEQFKVTDPKYYAAITKKYGGKNFEIVQSMLSIEEQKNLTNAKNKIKNKLNNNPLKNMSLLDFFEEKDHEKVKEIVISFKTEYPKYYDAIIKKYNGPNLEITTNITLNKNESNNLSNAKRLIKKILSNSTTVKRGKGFLNFFEEKDYDKVLEIIKQFETTNKNYYETINKKYSGDKYEIVNNIKLSRKEYNNLILARKKINKILNLQQEQSISEKNSIAEIDKEIVEENKYEVKITETVQNQQTELSKTQINHIYSIQDILYILPNKPIDNILMSQIIKNRQNILRIITIDEVIDCYIDNLEYFKDEDAITIIKTISMYCPDKITKIINSSYLCDKLKGLTLKEQEYIYLTLHSYSNRFLTKDIISEMLDINKKELEKYEIMSQYDEVNKLNVLFKD